MKNKYRYTKTTVSLINYHFIFCPRYRRKIFLISNDTIVNLFVRIIDSKSLIETD